MTDAQITAMMREITAHEDRARRERAQSRYTISEAERVFDIPRRTLYNWMQRHYLGWSIQRHSGRVVLVVTEGQVRDAMRAAKQAKSDHISAGVNRALGKG